MTKENTTKKDRLESLVERQTETIERQEHVIQELRETVERLEAGSDGTKAGDRTITRRGALKAGGLLGLVGFGTGTAAAQDATGQVGTGPRPVDTVYTAALNGPLTGSQELTSLVGDGLTVESGALTSSVADLEITEFEIVGQPTGEGFTVEVTVAETGGVTPVGSEVSLRVGAPFVRYEQTIDATGLSGGGTVTVTFGVDDGTDKVGPLTAGTYTASVTLDATNAGAETELTSFSVVDPTNLITTWHDLDDVRNDLDGTYALGADLDSGTEGYSDVVSTPTEGFVPIGDGGAPFTGTFDGSGGEIADLRIDRPDPTGDGQNGDDAGLFGRVGGGGTVTDVHVVNADVSAGNGTDDLGGNGNGGDGGDAGALVASNAGEVSGATASSVSVAGGDGGDGEGKGGDGGGVGALVGVNEGTGTIDGVRVEPPDSSLTAGTGGVGTSSTDGSPGGTGGVVGLNNGTVTDATAATDVDDTTLGVGGVVGRNDGDITRARATGNVTGNVTGNSDVGGLVGFNGGTISESYATGDVDGGDVLGGLVGRISAGTVEESYATGDVGSGSSGSTRGGLVGVISDGTVEESYATGDVDGGDRLGGLAGGIVSATVDESYAAGNVTGNSDLGGLIGDDVGDSTVTKSYWDVPATGQDTSAGGTGIGSLGDTPPAAGMVGTNLDSRLESDFDFGNVWEKVAESETTADAYPVLRALNRDDQLEARQ